MTRSDLIIRFMSGKYGLTLDLAQDFADWVEEDRRRICAPLVKYKAFRTRTKRIGAKSHINDAIDETLKLAGLE